MSPRSTSRSSRKEGKRPLTDSIGSNTTSMRDPRSPNDSQQSSRRSSATSYDSTIRPSTTEEISKAFAYLSTSPSSYGTSTDTQSRTAIDPVPNGSSTQAEGSRSIQRPDLAQSASWTDGDEDNYRVKPKSFYRIGRILVMIWSEPASHSVAPEGTAHLYAGHYNLNLGARGKAVFQKQRRFVVIREYDQHCIALAITTHDGRGVSGIRGTKWHYSVIYSGSREPELLPGELSTRNELPMQPIAIRVLPDLKAERLRPESRLNYGKLYTIEYNVPVRSFGVVHHAYQQALITQFTNVFTQAPRAHTANTSSAAQARVAAATHASTPTIGRPMQQQVAPRATPVESQLGEQVRFVAAELRRLHPTLSADQALRAAAQHVQTRLQALTASIDANAAATEVEGEDDEQDADDGDEAAAGSDEEE